MKKITFLIILLASITNAQTDTRIYDIVKNVKTERIKKIEGIFKDGKPWGVFETQRVISTSLNSSGKVSQETMEVMYGDRVGDDWIWFKEGNDWSDIKYCGGIRNEKPNGKGILRFPDGKKIEGIFKDGKPWDVFETQNWKC